MFRQYNSDILWKFLWFSLRCLRCLQLCHRRQVDKIAHGYVISPIWPLWCADEVSTNLCVLPVASLGGGGWRVPCTKLRKLLWKRPSNCKQFNNWMIDPHLLHPVDHLLTPLKVLHIRNTNIHILVLTYSKSVLTDYWSHFSGVSVSMNVYLLMAEIIFNNWYSVWYIHSLL